MDPRLEVRLPVASVVRRRVLPGVLPLVDSVVRRLVVRHPVASVVRPGVLPLAVSVARPPAVRLVSAVLRLGRQWGRLREVRLGLVGQWSQQDWGYRWQQVVAARFSSATRS